MTVLRMSYLSQVLHMTTTCSIILPQELTSEELPVLYLLHGYSDNDEAWLLNSRITKLVENLNIAVVMPSNYNGYYTDSVTGNQTYSYLVEELFPYLEQLLHLSKKSENRYLAGLSMGGYGAFKMGLLQKNQFAKVYSLSGALDIASLYEDPKTRQQPFTTIFGNKEVFRSSDNDLMVLGEQAKKTSIPITEFVMICGRQDFLFENNNRFYQANKANLRLDYRVFEGKHDWAFWDRQLATIVNEVKIDQQKREDLDGE